MKKPQTKPASLKVQPANQLSLDQLKQQCPLPTLMEHLGLGKYAKASSKSPFRADHNASWGIFTTDKGWRFKDHGTGDSGDEIAFLANHLRLDQRENFPLLLGVYRAAAMKVGSHPPATAHSVPTLPTRESAGISLLPDKTGFGPATNDQPQQLAELRGFSVESVNWAVERGVLVFGDWHGLQCYGVCDSSGRLVELRRLDGQNFPAVGQLQERKSHTLKHSQKSWPLGLPEAHEASNVLLVEGLPDFIAAHELILAGQLVQQWAPVAMLSAGTQIAAEALSDFNGKRVLICFHNDPGHQGGQAALNWRKQLQSANGAQISLLDTRKLSVAANGSIKDLNDYVRQAKSGLHPQLPTVGTLLSNF